MLTISMFLGIIITMYYDELESHNMPHFHARYQGNEAVFALDGNLIIGSLPSKQTKLVEAWAAIHEDELKANWELAANQTPLFPIDPLR